MRRIALSACVALGLLGTFLIFNHGLAEIGPKAPDASSRTARLSGHPVAPLHPTRARNTAVIQKYDRLPMAFEPNVGQTSRQVGFLARGTGYIAFLTPSEAVLSLRETGKRTQARTAKTKRATPLMPAPIRSTALSMTLVGANAHARLQATDKLPGVSNYFIGKNPSGWHANIPNYRRVEERGIYPGIDLVYYGTQRELEYDFVVSPGARPERIQLAIAGSHGLRIDRRGTIEAAIAGGAVEFHRPVAYQVADGKKTPVAAAYVLESANRVSLRLGNYDRSRPLVIDPVLAYSTYLGGSGIDGANGIAVAADDTAFVTGGTLSPNFPLANAYQATYGGSEDVFVSKLSADGSTLIYSTYLGGKAQDVGNGIAVDSAGDAYVTGSTISGDFPFSPLAAFPNCGGDAECGASWNTQGNVVSNGFVTKLSITGTQIVYSTSVGVYEHVSSHAIAVDVNGIAYITGEVEGALPVTITPAPVGCPGLFPTTNGFEPNYPGGTPLSSDGCPYIGGGAATSGFVMALSANGEGVLYSSYLGGTVQDVGFGIAADGSQNAYVTGLTYSSDFPTTANGLQLTYGGAGDGFLAKVNTTGSGTSSLLYSTFLGGNALDQGNAVTVDSGGDAYVAGGTSSNTLTFAPNAGILNSYNAAGDAFVCELNPGLSAGASLVWFRYLGGSLADSANGVALDSGGDVYLTGSTVSQDFPVLDAFQAKYAGGNADAFVTQLSPDGSTLLYSSFLGGTNTDIGNGIAVDQNGNAYVAGQTCSLDFPLANPLQGTPGGNCDAFVSEVSTQTGIALSPSGLVFSAQSLGTASTPQTVTLTNNESTAVSFTGSGITIGPSGNPDASEFSQTNTCGSSVGPGGTCTITVTFTPTVSGLSKADVEVNDTAPGSPQVVSLSGSTSTLTLSQTTLPFNNVAVGTTSPAETITATNDGTTPITFSNITASGAYSESDDCTKAPLQPTTNCTISVTLTPTTVGQTIGALELYDDAPGSPQEVLLTGNGVLPAVNISPASLTFQTQNVGTTSAAQVVAVNNTGLVQVTFSSIAASGPFAETDNCSKTPLQAQTSCTINVTFSPVASGSASGALTLTDNVPGSPQIVSLLGTGAGSSGGGGGTSSFAITAQPGTATISAGQTASFTVTVTPSGSFSSPVTLSCSNLPSQAACLINPNPVTPTGATNATVQISTVARSSVPASPWSPAGPSGAFRVLIAAWLAVLLLVLAAGRILPGLRIRRAVPVLALALTALLLSAACGGGTRIGTGQGTPAGTYQISIVGTSGSTTTSTSVGLQVN